MLRHVQKLYQKILLVALFFIVGATAMAYPIYGYEDDPFVPDQEVDFTLLSYSYTVSCYGEYVIIRWALEGAENLTYKIRRRTINGYTDGRPLYEDERWIATYIMANSRDRYITIDFNIEIGVNYSYTLHGANLNTPVITPTEKIVNFSEIVSFSCLYLPLIYP